MSAYKMTLTVLATELAEAVAKDQKPVEGGCDLGAGMYGKHVSAWLRHVAEQLAPHQTDKADKADPAAPVAVAAQQDEDSSEPSSEPASGYPDAVRYRAVRQYGDARDSSFQDDCDARVDSWLNHLKVHDAGAFAALFRAPVAQTALPLPALTAAQRARGFAWLQDLQACADAPDEAGVALQAWHEATTALAPFAALSVPEDFVDYEPAELADMADQTDCWVSRSNIRAARAALVGVHAARRQADHASGAPSTEGSQANYDRPAEA